MLDESATFQQSIVLCEQYGGKLATIHSSENLSDIQDLCNENGQAQLCWIGGIHDNTGDNCTYSWHDGSEWDYDPPKIRNHTIIIQWIRNIRRC